MTFKLDRDTIRWGIIGCGDVTEVKSGPGFQKATNSALVAVMRRSGDKAADYAKRHNIPRWYDDAAKLIADPEVDAVYIATPPGSHMQYTLEVAAAGKPVYVEKPMARTHDECTKMVEACKRAGVPLFVAYYRRRLPRILRVKQLIDSGAIGEVRFVQHTLFQRPNAQEKTRDALPWRVIPELAGGGRFLDLASHALDVFDYLFGPVAEATGCAANQAKLYDAEDIVTGNWVHQSGVIGSCTLCFTTFDRIDRCEIVGSKGVITFQVIEGGPIEVWTAGGKQHYDDPNPLHVQQPLIQSVVDDLRGVGTCPSTGESAARTSWVMDRMLEEYRAGRHQ
ncbi:Gfo/Idh/MocA family protein [Humisphaera borealis]|uniref:Gfo/Idh/MocA family oxidoreductase n=1 Tax=Humisphaera borealis TaxID=2807512 RepID=A0A7M2WZM8_9BACT|nr:Gfo/Idh/MocA family oxidoreductase [Humisphaera borealis]QOV90853.1 Gfo/Idh/MocA family oxidoreductase [Humisphaera borealis]